MRKRLSTGVKKRGRSVVMPPTVGYRSVNGSARDSRRTRLCLRPWMEALLDSKKCPILRWVDKNRKEFSIAWRHASSNGFDPLKHGDLFYRWAEHTGKVEKNIGANHSSNKSTFRCALNSLPDCIQLTKEGEKKGEGAKRTYMFIDKSHPSYGLKRKAQHQKKLIQPKEENLYSPSFPPEVDNTLLKTEPGPSTWKSEQKFPDYFESESETWSCRRTEVISPAFDEKSSSSSTVEFFVMENFAVSGPSSPVAPMEVNMRMGLSGCPLPGDVNNSSLVPNLADLLTPAPTRNSRIVTQMQEDGVIAVELHNLGPGEHTITMPPVAQNNVLPMFCELVVGERRSEADEKRIYLPSLNSGGSVTVTTTQPMALSQPEYVIDPTLLALFNGNPFEANAVNLDFIQDLSDTDSFNFEDAMLLLDQE